MPVVSIVMPSYNHAQYIGYAIESILRQDFADFELIVIDDDSKDNSAEVIKVLARRINGSRRFITIPTQGFTEPIMKGLTRPGANTLPLLILTMFGRRISYPNSFASWSLTGTLSSGQKLRSSTRRGSLREKSLRSNTVILTRNWRDAFSGSF